MKSLHPYWLVNTNQNDIIVCFKWIVTENFCIIACQLKTIKTRKDARVYRCIVVKFGFFSRKVYKTT